MEKRVTIYELAEKVGVSPSTVNRALNGKVNVKPELKQQIVDAAREMGYKYNTVAASLSREPIKIAAVALYTGEFAFANEVERGMKKAIDNLRDRNLMGEIVSLPPTCTAKQYCDAVKESVGKGCNALILLPHYDEQEMAKLFYYLSEQNIPVGTVVSDIPNAKRVISLRRNGMLCGGWAAELLGVLTGGDKRLAVMTGSMDNIVHNESTKAFEDVAAQNSIEVAGVFVHNDDPEIARGLADTIANEYPDVGGVYFNSANSTAFCNRIRELELNGKLKIITTDLFAELAAYLEDGTVSYTLFCNPYLQGKMAVECMYKHLAERRDYHGGDILIDPQIVTKWNMDYYTNYNAIRNGDRGKDGEI